MAPDLDRWLSDPIIRIAHRRAAAVDPEALWQAACAVRLADTRRLGRLVGWRIPGLDPTLRFDELFRAAPFTELDAGDGWLVAGIVGRIWTLRRDYPRVTPEEFVGWSAPGTVRVLFANWVEPESSGAGGAEGAALASEIRVAAVDRLARLGLAAVRPLIAGSHHLIASDGLDAAIRAADG